MQRAEKSEFHKKIHETGKQRVSHAISGKSQCTDPQSQAVMYSCSAYRPTSLDSETVDYVMKIKRMNCPLSVPVRKRWKKRSESDKQ